MAREGGRLRQVVLSNASFYNVPMHWLGKTFWLTLCFTTGWSLHRVLDAPADWLGWTVAAGCGVLLVVLYRTYGRVWRAPARHTRPHTLPDTSAGASASSGSPLCNLSPRGT